MYSVGNQRYNTVSDAARLLKVSAKTVQSYITKGIIDSPPTITIGLKELQVFPEEYLEGAKQRISEHSRSQKEKRNHRQVRV